VPVGELAHGMPASAAAAGHAATHTEKERVIQALATIEGEDLASAADSLRELVDHYSYAVCAVRPAIVYDELLAVRSYADTLIGRSGPRRPDLVVAMGWLSNLLAVAACDMGEHATSRVWCSDSERRSRDSGHPELGAWSYLTRAMIAYYQGQSRQSVTLAARGRASVPLGTVAHARLAAQEMRAAAMAGDAAGMARARTYAATAIERLPPGARTAGAFSVAIGEDPPYTATSLLLVGNFREAVSATGRVISTVYRPEARQRGENPSGYARSLLILGLAHAGSRCLDEAVAAGQDALSGSRPAWPTMVLAGHLDRALARDFAGSRQTAAYHARYLETTGQPPGSA
jgi:hypothetical protein